MVHYHLFEIAVEYERTLKASEKYEELIARLETETRADLVLYLFSDEQIGAHLQWMFRNTRKEIVLVQLQEFVRNPLAAPAMCRYLPTTLGDTLRRLSCRKAATVSR
jgi:hypothetical protein